MGTPGSMEEILTRFKGRERVYKKNIINSWPMVTYTKHT